MLDSICELAKEKKVLHTAVKESIFGGNIVLTQGLTERERRLLLREMERKRRNLGIMGEEQSTYAKLSTAGANIAFKAETEIESNTQNRERNAYCNDVATKNNQKEYRKYLGIKLEDQDGNKVLDHPNLPVFDEPKVRSTAESFARFKKKGITQEVIDKKEKQMLLIQTELTKQIEEKRQRKFIEKQRRKEEDEKEDQRVKKEQVELAKLEENKSNKGSIDRIELRSPPKLEMPPVEKNVFQYVVQGYNMGSYNPKNVKSTRRLNMDKSQASQNIIENYQKQIEILKNEKQLAKEEVLIYKEQLLRERELQLQSMMSQIAVTAVTKQSAQSRLNQPAVRPESKETCEESIESSLRRIPTRENINGKKNRADPLEQSLVSSTKFVIQHNKIDGDYMYETWKPIENQKHTEKIVEPIDPKSKVSTMNANQTVEPKVKHEIINEESIFCYNL